MNVFFQIRKLSGLVDDESRKKDSNRSVTSEWEALQVKHKQNENGSIALIYLRVTCNKKPVHSGWGEWEWILEQRSQC